MLGPGGMYVSVCMCSYVMCLCLCVCVLKPSCVWVCVWWARLSRPVTMKSRCCGEGRRGGLVYSTNKIPVSLSTAYLSTCLQVYTSTCLSISLCQVHMPICLPVFLQPLPVSLPVEMNLAADPISYDACWI